MYLLIDKGNAFPLGADGGLLLVDAPPAPTTTHVTLPGGITAARLAGTRAADLADRVGDARSWAGDPLVAQAVGRLRAVEHTRFDPADGSELTWDPAARSARGASGREVFPRIDPCVIGLVENLAGDAILLGENARRPGYFTCVAGYIDVGETAEDAWRREVLEETGRRVDTATYLGSQPWPHTGALMLAFTSRTADIDSVAGTDGELRSIRWATRADLDNLPLAGPGSIARRLIDGWHRRTSEGDEQWQSI